MKQYEIEVYEKGRHGYYKAQHFSDLDMILSADTLDQVKSFAIDVLATMTFEEVYGKKNIYGCERIEQADGTHKLRYFEANEKIGIEIALKSFTIKARVFKG